MYLYGVNTEIGYNSEGYFLYIGLPEPDITQGENSGDETYRIDRAEKVYKGGEVFYIWAVIRKTVNPEEENE